MARLNLCPLCATEPCPKGEPILRITAEVDRRGEWCGRCALPSVFVLSLVVACRHGWPSGGAGSVAWCVDHAEYVAVPMIG